MTSLSQVDDTRGSKSEIKSVENRDSKSGPMAGGIFRSSKDQWFCCLTCPTVTANDDLDFRFSSVIEDGELQPLMRFRATPIFLYACESWTLTAELQRRMQAMETRCYHRILCISYEDHVTNEEVRAKISRQTT